MDRSTMNHTLKRRSGVTWAIAAASLVTAGRATAAETSLIATLDSTVDSFFTLDFGEFGGEREAFISSTSYELRIDETAETARFVRYRQDIEPITIPLGSEEISTGDITVEIVPGSSTGSYDSETGEFTTTETYAIYFDDSQLRDYGITSPFLLPSTSTGTVYYDTEWTGDVVMTWEGGGVLAGLVPFEYTCSVFATFAPPKVRNRETGVSPAPDEGIAGVRESR